MIIDVIREYIPSRHKVTPSGWISFNCVACHHYGHKPDTRGRAGIKMDDNSYSYHCFNCGFTTRWETGSYFSKKNEELFEYLGVPKNIQGKCKLSALGQHDSYEEDDDEEDQEPRIYHLPKGAKTFNQLIKENCSNLKFLRALEYIGNRNVNLLDWHDFYWVNSKENDMSNRFIIPVISNNKIIGYNARTVNNNKLKYIAQVNKSVVFNSDLLYNNNRKYCTITEGPIDAISICGTASMSNDPTDSQIQQYNSSKQIKVVIPDNDISGKKLIDIAIDNGWYVSFPKWSEKDCGDAVAKYGRLASVTHIFDMIETSPLKIQLKAKKIGDSNFASKIRYGTPRTIYNNDVVRT